MDTMIDDRMDTAFVPTFPITASKRQLASPPEVGHKTPRTTQNEHQHAEEVQASFLLRAADGARVFANPSHVSKAL